MLVWGEASQSGSSHSIMAVSRYFLSVLAVLTLSTWKYLDKADPPFQNKSQEEEKEKQNVLLMDEKKMLRHMTENLKLQSKKNLKNRLVFEPAVAASSGSFPLDAVFLFLLIHTFGGEKSELVKKNAELQIESQNKEKDRDDVVNTLMELKAELEDQRGRLRGQLEDVEREKEGNKQKLQEVEKEIMEKERTFDKPEEQLKEKEDLLRVQWKLDQTKKENERQLLNTEKLLEPIEVQITKIQQTQGDDIQI